MLIDSHAHLNFEDFTGDWQEVIADCLKNDTWLVNVGAQWQTSQRAVEIAENYEKGIYAAVGLHPIHVLGSNFHPEDFAVGQYRKLIGSSKKIVALGETGFDFYHDDKNIASQTEVFLKHLTLAKEFNLPLILHARNSKDGKLNAYEKILAEISQPVGQPEIRGVIHCFGGTVEEALAFLKLGFFIGFTGVVTFDKTGRSAEVISNLPLESILIETDSPYLAPVPFRGQRNQPQYVKYVAAKIAEIKGLAYNKIVEQTAENANKLFKLT